VPEDETPEKAEEPVHATVAPEPVATAASSEAGRSAEEEERPEP
jgi:hypothetical protein